MNKSQDLAGLRTMFKRNADGMRLFGWTTEFDSETIQVRTSTEEVMRVGDSFDFIVFGDRNCGLFRAVFDKVMNYDPMQSKSTTLDVGSLIEIYETLLRFRFVSLISFQESIADARKLAAGIDGHISVEKEKVPVQALDISLGGAGLLSYVELPTDQEVELVLKLANTKTEIPAKVRYCRPHRTIEGMFRVGVKFDQVSRVDQAHLHNLLKSA